MTEAVDNLSDADADVSASRKATRQKWLRRLFVILAIVGLGWGACASLCWVQEECWRGLGGLRDWFRLPSLRF